MELTGNEPSRRRQRTTTVISVWPRPAFNQNFPWGQFEIEGCPKCEKHKKGPCASCKPYAMRVFHASIMSDDLGDDRRRVEKVDDLDLALDIEDRHKHFGVVVCDGDQPTQAEIDRAYEQVAAYLKMVVENEDSIWSVHKRHYNAEHALIGLDFFGQKREWGSDTTTKQPCPACSTMNPMSIARCSNTQCGAVQNWALAREYGVLRPDEVKFGLATGKLTPIPGLDELADEEPAPTKKKVS